MNADLSDHLYGQPSRPAPAPTPAVPLPSVLPKPALEKPSEPETKSK